MLPMILIASLMSACVTGSRTSGWCDLNSPRYITAKTASVLTKEEKTEIIVHNEFGKERCGWKPVTK